MPDESKESPSAGHRPFWSGMLTFGLVSIPVDLYPSTRSGGAPLRLLDEDGVPLQRRYYCAEHDQEVPSEHLVRGYEISKDKYVVVTDEELEAIDPKKSREIDLRLFVPEEELDPLYFEHAYFLAPGADSGKAYQLLSTVMEKTKRAGIATFVMRDQEYLVAIVSQGGILRGETLRFHDEVRSAKGVGLSKAKEPSAALVKRFAGAIKKLETERLPTAELSDDHSEELKALAEKKYKKRQDVLRPEKGVESAPSEGADVIDLMAALKKSLGQHRVKGSAKPAKAGGTRKTHRKAAAHPKRHAAR